MDYSALLTRPAWTFDEQKIDLHLEGKRVMVTGAGGTIGSAVVRRISQADVEHIKLVDNSEISLFNLLNERSITVPHSAQVLDICSRPMEDLVRSECPDIIVHAAAFKHVGLMESCPMSAYHNNTQGTIKLARSARDCGVGQFLFVSTDKAAKPTNYMGASKRLAEAWLFTHSRDNLKVCRFGNVLGSSGSLVEIVARRLLSDLPVQITDPDMERYFITPDEAVGLLLTSLTLEGCGPFSIEMGSPVNIVELVQRVADQLNKTLDLEFTWVGAGEKLTEDLINPGEVKNPTEHPGIFSLGASSFGNVSRLISSVGTRHEDMVIAANSLEAGTEDYHYV